MIAASDQLEHSDDFSPSVTVPFFDPKPPPSIVTRAAESCGIGAGSVCRPARITQEGDLVVSSKRVADAKARSCSPDFRRS
jgi:hypothetical protein